MTTLALRLIACSVAAAFLSPAGEPVAPSRHRTIDARIVGERYRPLGPVRRDIEARAQAAELVLKWRATPQLSRWAYSALELGRELELVSTAQALLEKGPDYEVLVALSAAYSHIASQGDDVVAAARALDAAKRGTLVAPGRPEAWFNLAVATEQLGLSGWENPWPSLHARGSPTRSGRSRPRDVRSQPELVWRRLVRRRLPGVHPQPRARHAHPNRTRAGAGVGATHARSRSQWAPRRR